MAYLTEILERLVRANVEFVIVGGVAVMVYGTGLMTDDIDVCVPFTQENLQRIATAISDLHPYHRMTPQRLAFDVHTTSAIGLRNLYLGTDLGDLDLLGEVLGLGAYPSVLAGSVAVRMPYGECRLLTLESIIASKKAMNREKDRAAVRLLVSIQESARGAVNPDFQL